MAKKIKIEFTEKEANEILSVAGNGYGDGDFYGISEDNSSGQGYGGKREQDAFFRAYEKIAIALNRKDTRP